MEKSKKKIVVAVVTGVFLIGGLVSCNASKTPKVEDKPAKVATSIKKDNTEKRKKESKVEAKKKNTKGKNEVKIEKRRKKAFAYNSSKKVTTSTTSRSTGNEVNKRLAHTRSYKSNKSSSYTVPSKPKSSSSNTSATKPSKPQHSHCYNIPIYSTRTIPVYSERTCFYFPSDGTKFYSRSEAFNHQNDLADADKPCNYTILAEKYQTGTRTESYISGYKCSCGSVK